MHKVNRMRGLLNVEARMSDFRAVNQEAILPTIKSRHPTEETHVLQIL